jgi:hypothetical protein
MTEKVCSLKKVDLKSFKNTLKINFMAKKIKYLGSDPELFERRIQIRNTENLDLHEQPTKYVCTLHYL